MMSPLHHVFCGTHFLIDVLSVCVCVSCLYASCVCSIEIIIVTHNSLYWEELYLGSFLLACTRKILGMSCDRFFWCTKDYISVVASFPGRSRLKFLIAYCMQKWRGEAWEKESHA